MSVVSSSVLNLQGQGTRQSARQTRTNPSRTSKTVGRSSFAFGRGSTAEIPASPPVPHGFYPAITHFTDAITALPREFRRHSSLLKEVDAKAWTLEENLLQLLRDAEASEPVPHPTHPAPIVGGMVREDFLPKVYSAHGIVLVDEQHSDGCVSFRILHRPPSHPRAKIADSSSIACDEIFPTS